MVSETVTSPRPSDDARPADNGNWLASVLACVQRVVPIKRNGRLAQVLLCLAGWAFRSEVGVGIDAIVWSTDPSILEYFFGADNDVLDAILKVELPDFGNEQFNDCVERLLSEIYVVSDRKPSIF